MAVSQQHRRRPVALGGDIFAAGGARLERIVMRLCQKPGRIELGRTRLRRGGGPFGRLILCARFRRINRRQMVIRLPAARRLREPF